MLTVKRVGVRRVPQWADYRCRIKTVTFHLLQQKLRQLLLAQKLRLSNALTSNRGEHRKLISWHLSNCMNTSQFISRCRKWFLESVRPPPMFRCYCPLRRWTERWPCHWTQTRGSLCVVLCSRSTSLGPATKNTLSQIVTHFDKWNHERKTAPQLTEMYC